MANSRSDESRRAARGDEITADISATLNNLHLDGSVAMSETIPPPSLTGNKNEPRTAHMQGGSRVESTISNSQVTPGRDMISYNISGNLTGGTTDSDKNSPESRRNYIDDEDDIAANMLIPASPMCILERDTQHSEIVTKLLSSTNARVAILGMGGIGKTTLACSVANDPQVEDAYPRRLFLSFEGCSTPDLAYTHLAAAFQIPKDRRSSHRQILSHVLKYLKQGKALFIIDNFETFWEVSSNRRAAEDFLAQLAALPKLALIVTLRGIQRPGNIRWLRIDPLETLTHDAAEELLSIIMDKEYAKGDSEYIQKLLDAVAGIPLAVTLIGSLLRDESETPKSLWHQWTQESARAIRVANEIDSDDRLYKLDISLRLSIYGPRMSDNAKGVLVAVSILPNGLSMDDEWLDNFQSTLPTTIRMRDCIRTLRDVALVTFDLSTTPHRLRLLSPIRDFCLNNLSLDQEIARRLIDTYNADLKNHSNWGSSDNYTWIITEISNVNAVLNHAINICYVSDDLGEAIGGYAEWRRFLCIPETETIQRGVDALSQHPSAKAKCLQSLGYTLQEFQRADEAIPILEQALSIYKGLDNKSDVGWTLYVLSRAYLGLGEYSRAEIYLGEAGDHFKELGYKWEEGSVLRSLAEVYSCQNKLQEAESAVKEGLELALVSGNRRGEVLALGTLGEINGKQGKYDLAVENLTAARNVSQATHDTHYEAWTNAMLGFVYRDTNKPDQAAVHFRLAVSLYERVQQTRYAEDIRACLREIENHPDLE